MIEGFVPDCANACDVGIGPVAVSEVAIPGVVDGGFRARRTCALFVQKVTFAPDSSVGNLKTSGG
eukprot:CAMPEP_0119095180 /NCGR_PEP_ID=MMETSP1178-20130426/168698_1 /TAXON_ID=33656 /ORGANISM="unid sp, Strain CCMP2000" /LENGTH=64 /DNA_ID=CAMNT_0007078971 /DNA_START=113 /DNA_END=304 /DNA_ORIENTATION=+